MMKKKLLATLLTLSMTATTLAGTTVVSAAEEHEPVELTIWVTSRNQDDWYLSMEEKFLEEHPWITLNKVVKEGDPGNEFYQGVASGTAKLLLYHDGFLYCSRNPGATECLYRQLGRMGKLYQRICGYVYKRR